MLEFNGEYPASLSKAKFWRFSVKNRKKSALKQHGKIYFAYFAILLRFAYNFLSRTVNV